MVERYDHETLLAYLEDELAPDERARFEAQLAADAELRQLAEQLAADRAALRSLPREQPPAGLVDDAIHQLEREMLLGAPADEPIPFQPTARPPRRHRILKAAAYSGLAAVVLLSGGLIVWTLNGTHVVDTAQRLASIGNGGERSRAAPDADAAPPPSSPPQVALNGEAARTLQDEPEQAEAARRREPELALDALPDELALRDDAAMNDALAAREAPAGDDESDEGPTLMARTAEAPSNFATAAGGEDDAGAEGLSIESRLEGMMASKFRRQAFSLTPGESTALRQTDDATGGTPAVIDTMRSREPTMPAWSSRDRLFDMDTLTLIPQQQPSRDAQASTTTPNDHDASAGPAPSRRVVLLQMLAPDIDIQQAQADVESWAIEHAAKVQPTDKPLAGGEQAIPPSDESIAGLTLTDDQPSSDGDGESAATDMPHESPASDAVDEPVEAGADEASPNLRLQLTPAKLDELLAHLNRDPSRQRAQLLPETGDDAMALPDDDAAAPTPTPPDWEAMLRPRLMPPPLPLSFSDAPPTPAASTFDATVETRTKTEVATDATEADEALDDGVTIEVEVRIVPAPAKQPSP